MHRKVPAWFGGGERGKGPSTWEDTSPRSLSCHLAYVREHAGHALIGARQWIPAACIEDPVKSLVMGLPLDLEFRTKGQLAIDIAAGALADGITFDFFCGDEVYGSCTELREYLEGEGQAYVLRVASSFLVTLAVGTRMSCADAEAALLKDKKRCRFQSLHFTQYLCIGGKGVCDERCRWDPGALTCHGVVDTPRCTRASIT